jgi:aryl-alcohol dehydrogenase-like predicted oxidoreductase
MRNKGKSITRKDFIKKSSIGIIGTGMMATGPINLLNTKVKLSYTAIGKTGIETTKLGIGATRTQESNIIKAAIDGGIRFLDTGRTYANGKNEEMIGEVIKDIRKEVTLQSKLKINEEEIQNKIQNESREHVISNIFNKSIEESLLALQTDYIDIMLLHGARETTLLYDEAFLKVFEKAIKSGKIRASGFSTHSNQATLVAHNNAHPFYDVIMVAFNHSGGYNHSRSGRKYDWDQANLVKELKTAAASGTGIVAMKTCSGGAYSMDPDREASLPQAVKWILMQSYVHTAVPAMASFSQVESHINENKA